MGHSSKEGESALQLGVRPRVLNKGLSITVSRSGLRFYLLAFWESDPAKDYDMPTRPTERVDARGDFKFHRDLRSVVLVASSYRVSDQVGDQGNWERSSAQSFLDGRLSYDDPSNIDKFTMIVMQPENPSWGPGHVQLSTLNIIDGGVRRKSEVLELERSDRLLPVACNQTTPISYKLLWTYVSLSSILTNPRPDSVIDHPGSRICASAMPRTWQLHLCSLSMSGFQVLILQPCDFGTLSEHIIISMYS